LDQNHIVGAVQLQDASIASEWREKI
jgi:hypothetical protein